MMPCKECGYYQNIDEKIVLIRQQKAECKKHYVAGQAVKWLEFEEEFLLKEYDRKSRGKCPACANQVVEDE